MKVNASTLIDCPPHVLWTWLTETERSKRWLKGLIDATPTSAGPRRAGSTAVLKIQEGRRIAEYEERTLVFDAPRHLRFSMVGGCLKGMEFTVDYKLDDLGLRTRLDYECEVELGGFVKLFGPLFAIFGRLQLKRFLRTLKRLAEADAGVATAS